MFFFQLDSAQNLEFEPKLFQEIELLKVLKAVVLDLIESLNPIIGKPYQGLFCIE